MTHSPNLSKYQSLFIHIPNTISVPLTTPSTPILDNSAPIPEVQELTRVFVLEPVIVKSCEDMALQASQEVSRRYAIPPALVAGMQSLLP